MKIIVDATVELTDLSDALAKDDAIAWTVLSDTLEKMSDASFTQDFIFEQLEILLTSGQASTEFRKNIKTLLKETKESK